MGTLGHDNRLPFDVCMVSCAGIAYAGLVYVHLSARVC